MKKILFVLCLMFLFIGAVNAEVLNHNVDISEEGYEKLLEFMSDLEISMIDQKTYDLFMDNEIIGYQSYIVEEIYASSPTTLPRKVSERYLTVDEYANAPALTAVCSFSSGGTSETCETTKKRMMLL